MDDHRLIMLAKPIYEFIPYCYFIFGGFCILFSTALLPTAIGITLFLNGANIWRLRSNARRIDHKVNRRKVRKNHYYYEFKPFILLLTGLILVSRVPNQLVTLAGAMICLIGILILCLRILNRRSRSMV